MARSVLSSSALSKIAHADDHRQQVILSQYSTAGKAHTPDEVQWLEEQNQKADDKGIAMVRGLPIARDWEFEPSSLSACPRAAS